ncbi:MAG: 3'-5' exonuclease, partial [bacterium]|nr:3'-5' exonuclease [bacterium]
MVQSFVAIDVETTGLSPDKYHIIEVGALKVRGGEVVETFSSLINPGYELSSTIVNLTGITDEMLINAKSFKEVAEELREFLGKETLLGHNVSFDYRFLKTEFMRAGFKFDHPVIDTLAIAKQMHSDLKSRSLENLCRHYGLYNPNAHRAFDDAKVTMELYFAMMNGEKDAQNVSGLDQLANPGSYSYKIKKDSPITPRQKNYLLDLMKYHKIDNVQQVEKLTKREASRMIDQIILEKGRIQ